MSKLNKDILFLLFEELQYDSTSLFSCLLVNRLWCETVIPVLWRNPWRYNNNINYQSKSSLYNTITSFLSDDIKDSLTKQGVLLPSNSHQSSLFDYLSFCRSINTNVIKGIASIGSPSAYRQFILQQEIYGLCMRKCLELKYLDIRSIEHQIFLFAEAKNRLDSLCELKCDTSIDPSYFYGLARICQSIQSITIVNTDVRSIEGIVELIEAQRNLQSFEWVDDFSDYEYLYFAENTYYEIFIALENKSDTLVRLVIILNDEFDYEIPLTINLSKFQNLKSLIVDATYFEIENQLKQSCYRKLEILQIKYIETSTIIHLIKNGGRHLKKILVNEYCIDDDDDDHSILIRAIRENCPLVEHLTLAFSSSKEQFIEFEKLLETCQNLKTLILSINEEEIKFASGEKLSNALIKSAPNNLRDIRFGEFHSFYPGFKFSLKTLETFLENWRGRIPLSIMTSDPHYKGEEYMEIIDRYKDDGVIRDFTYDNIHFNFKAFVI